VGPGYAPGRDSQVLSESPPSVEPPKRNAAATRPSPQRALVFVDRFNLSYGLRSLGWAEYGWLDIPSLARTWLEPDQTLVAVHYFTARLRGGGGGSGERDRQSVYLEALQTQLEVQIHYGHFLERPFRCPVRGETSRRFAERTTDVQLAVQMLHHAHADTVDIGFLLSADSDLTHAIYASF